MRDVVAAETKISDIDGEAGRLWYVGYEIGDLATNASFEEVVYLLHNLDLPDRRQLEQLNTFLVRERELHPFLARFLPTLAQNTSPMSMLRTSISASSAFDPDGWDESPEAAVPQGDAPDRGDADADRHVPPAADRPGDHPAEPVARRTRRTSCGCCTARSPTRVDAEVLDTTFVLYADHTMNASTFTARDRRLDALRHVLGGLRRDRRPRRGRCTGARTRRR